MKGCNHPNSSHPWPIFPKLISPIANTTQTHLTHGQYHPNPSHSRPSIAQSPPQPPPSASQRPHPALTTLGVKPPGGHAGGHQGGGVRGQRDRQMDGARELHLGAIPREEVDAEGRHGRQLQPAGIGCRDTGHGAGERMGHRGAPLPPVPPVPLPLCSAPRKAGKPRRSRGAVAAVSDAQSWLYVELRGRRAARLWNCTHGWPRAPAG